VKMAPMCSLPGISIDVTFAAGGHTSAYASMRQRGIRIRQHTSAYVSIRQHTSRHLYRRHLHSHARGAYVSIRKHASAYVSIRQHTSAYVGIGQRDTRTYLERHAREAHIL
jgi:hypothetical protein